MLMLLNQDQDQLTGLSIAFCSSLTELIFEPWRLVNYPWNQFKLLFPHLIFHISYHVLRQRIEFCSMQYCHHLPDTRFNRGVIWSTTFFVIFAPSMIAHILSCFVWQNVSTLNVDFCKHSVALTLFWEQIKNLPKLGLTEWDCFQLTSMVSSSECSHLAKGLQQDKTR